MGFSVKWPDVLSGNGDTDKFNECVGSHSSVIQGINCWRLVWFLGVTVRELPSTGSALREWAITHKQDWMSYSRKGNPVFSTPYSRLTIV